MIQKFYVQTDGENKIRDVLEFPYSNYQEVSLETPIPPNIMCGAYQLMGGSVIYRPEWDRNADIETLKNELEITQSVVSELMFEGGI